MKDSRVNGRLDNHIKGAPSWSQLLAMGILGTVVFTAAVARFKKRLD